MKVRLRCKKENKERLTAMLSSGGFEVSEEGEFVFSENNYMPEYVVGKVKDGSGDLNMVNFSDIYYFESFGHEINMITNQGTFDVKDRMYQLEAYLPPNTFLRISQSVIVNRDNIKKISPGIGMRYYLVMKNGTRVDVTRSYYYRFKSEVGI